MKDQEETQSPFINPEARERALRLAAEKGPSRIMELTAQWGPYEEIDEEFDRILEQSRSEGRG